MGERSEDRKDRTKQSALGESGMLLVREMNRSSLRIFARSEFLDLEVSFKSSSVRILFLGPLTT